MAPTLYLVRHAQGEHNATRDFTILDPLLTPKGKQQCRELRESFRYHDTVDLVVASPLRRTIQTAVLSFGRTLARDGVPFIALPVAQEVSNAGADTGLEPEDLKTSLEHLFDEDKPDFNVLRKLDLSNVEEGWTSKSGFYAYTRPALENRAANFRSWLFQRSEERIIVVTHGAFLHFLTEDWDVDDPMTGTAYNNCEVRIFTFDTSSTVNNAHLNETEESKRTRGANERENDPHVLEELKTLASRPQ
ncbi:phosphoglycerate mutase family protein-like protein [Dendryphion nanum]|uniref:Phosphoglycerate mutase family protein-like protein n=1 Tax=Dendryphion nanum TaxID=256645 RepID=A0A9P9EDV4_9PLEO|nr:phosphoglycerate mutase family protein-like protein [Dendryphion nanum]